jgi:hypothetical protein
MAAHHEKHYHSLMSDAEAKDRRQARAGWPIVVRRLDEADDDISDVTTATERIAMMWPLAQEAWRLAGRPIPTYDRAHTPTRIFRPGESRPDDTDP